MGRVFNSLFLINFKYAINKKLYAPSRMAILYKGKTGRETLKM
jgi:hypothetical protein